MSGLSGFLQEERGARDLSAFWCATRKLGAGVHFWTPSGLQNVPFDQCLNCKSMRNLVGLPRFELRELLHPKPSRTKSKSCLFSTTCNESSWPQPVEPCGSLLNAGHLCSYKIIYIFRAPSLKSAKAPRCKYL